MHLYGHNNKENDAQTCRNSDNVYREEDWQDGAHAAGGDMGTGMYDIAPS